MTRLFFFLAACFSLPAFANVNGTHLQNFNPTTNGLDFVSVPSSKTLPASHFNLGLYFDYAANSLPFFKAPGVPNTQKFSEPNDRLVTAHFNIGFGILENWDVGITMPYVLSQDVGNSTQLGSYDDTGATEVRLNTKYRVWSQDDMGVAIVGSVNFDRIKNNPFSGSDAGATWNLEAAYDYQMKPDLLWGFNIGYRFADPGNTIVDTGVTPLGDQLIYSSALSYQYAPWDTTFIGEIFGSDFTETAVVPTDRKLSNMEILFAARKTVYERISAVAGLGTQLYRGLASPDLRLFVGANWLIGPVQPISPPPQQTVVVPVVETTFEEVPSETIILSSINFDTKKAQMTPESRVSMNQPLEQLRSNIGTIRLIIVEGHADHVGKDDYNQILSEKRARAVREVLMSELQLANNQVQARGYGESRPVATNETDEGRRKNRRVELKIYRNK